MNEGREALDKIKDQVEEIKRMQDAVQKQISKLNAGINREKKKLRSLVNAFPKKDWEMYAERVSQITTKYL